MTNYERIKNMSVEEMARKIIVYCDDEQIHFCKNKPECDAIIDDISDEMCSMCVMEWLKSDGDK